MGKISKLRFYLSEAKKTEIHEERQRDEQNNKVEHRCRLNMNTSSTSRTICTCSTKGGVVTNHKELGRPRFYEAPCQHDVHA